MSNALQPNRGGKMKEDNCCKDLGNWFFQYLSQDNKKVYECDVCDKIHILEIDKRKEEK